MLQGRYEFFWSGSLNEVEQTNSVPRIPTGENIPPAQMSMEVNTPAVVSSPIVQAECSHKALHTLPPVHGIVLLKLSVWRRVGKIWLLQKLLQVKSTEDFRREQL